MKLTPEQRKKVIDALVEDWITSLTNNGQTNVVIGEWLTDGRIGYVNYTDDELMSDALDADLTIAHDIAYDDKLDQYNQEKK